ncbi:MAG: DUF4342 domain-containing protein [Acidobacteria bacterium]|nr:DUF4342 domain-containing protein [Acidobacteriota bacterium]
MEEKSTVWETVRLHNSETLDRLQQLVHEGSMRRIVVKQRARTVAGFPAIGVLVAPIRDSSILAAIGALIVLIKRLFCRTVWAGYRRPARTSMNVNPG